MLSRTELPGSFRRLGVIFFSPQYVGGRRRAARPNDDPLIVTQIMREKWVETISALVYACKDANLLSEEGQTIDGNGLYTVKVI